MGTGKSSALDVQTAVVLRLRADATLNTLITGVFDEVPVDTEYPYVQVGESVESSFNTFDRLGKEVSFPISIWSEFEGFQEAYQILNRLNELLDFQTFTVNNFDLVLFRYTDANPIRDNTQRGYESSVKNVIANYQVILQEQ